MTSLTPVEPLSQVVFVHEYVQLVFQDESYSVYNVMKVSESGAEWIQGERGFCDALVGLIGQSVESVSSSKEHLLVFAFERGAQLLVLSGALGARGVEAFQFINKDGEIVIEQNA